MLEIRGLSKKYFGETVLEDINLVVEPGEIVGLFGENGAGKTTLLKCIPGLLKYEGQVLLDGEPVNNKNIGRISYAASEHSFFPLLDGRGHRDFYAEHFKNFREARFNALTDFLGLPLNKKLKNLSSGQQSQFEAVLALCQGADYILIDELFAGSDIFRREDFYKILIGISEPEESVILSTHLAGEVGNLVGRAVVLAGGRVIADEDMSELEEEGMDLTGFLRKTCGYDSRRIEMIFDEFPH